MNIRHKALFERMAKSKLPPLLATDGSSAPTADGRRFNSAAVGLFVYEGVLDDDNNWMHDEWTPLIFRINYLPERLGA